MTTQRVMMKDAKALSRDDHRLTVSSYERFTICTLSFIFMRFAS